MRVLMISDIPHVPELGGARAQMDVADGLRARGHDVDVFSGADLPSDMRQRHLRRIDTRRFARAARRHVRAVGAHYDVVEALEGNLPYSKASLWLSGHQVLATRSAGSHILYQDYLRTERERFGSEVPGTPTNRRLVSIGVALATRNAAWSMGAADLVHVLTVDEERAALTRLGITSAKVVRIPNPIADDHFARLAQRSRTLESNHVVSVATWALRKGRTDWPYIVARVRRDVPGARFTLLGTFVGADEVLRAFSPGDRSSVRVVTSFPPADLPALLDDAACGAFPSYMEGWGLGLAEMLAAGVPVVAYDVPGVRTVLERFKEQLLVPAGDAGALAERLISLLRAPQLDLSVSVRREMTAFRASTVAKLTEDAYAAALARAPQQPRTQQIPASGGAALTRRPPRLAPKSSRGVG